MSNPMQSRAHAASSESGREAQESASPPASNREDRTARHGLSPERVVDPAEVVKRARKVFDRFLGWQVTPVSAEMMAGALWLEFPRLSRHEAEQLAAPEVMRGKVFDVNEVVARANNVATALIVGDLL